MMLDPPSTRNRRGLDDQMNGSEEDNDIQMQFTSSDIKRGVDNCIRKLESYYSGTSHVNTIATILYLLMITGETIH
jgi:hypothetical protein